MYVECTQIICLRRTFYEVYEVRACTSTTRSGPGGRRDLTTVATHACLTRKFGATPSAVPRLEKDAKAMVARFRAERRVRNNPSAVYTNP